MQPTSLALWGAPAATRTNAGNAHGSGACTNSRDSVVADMLFRELQSRSTTNILQQNGEAMRHEGSQLQLEHEGALLEKMKQILSADGRAMTLRDGRRSNAEAGQPHARMGSHSSHQEEDKCTAAKNLPRTGSMTVGQLREEDALNFYRSMAARARRE